MSQSLIKCKECDGYGEIGSNILSPSYITALKCPFCNGTGLDPSVEIIYGTEKNEPQASSRD